MKADRLAFRVFNYRTNCYFNPIRKIELQIKDGLICNNSFESNMNDRIFISNDNWVYKILNGKIVDYTYSDGNIEIEFWTGYKDKNNVMLYENDIIIWDNGIKGIVRQDEYTNEFYIDTNNDTLRLNKIHMNFEIIGDIHTYRSKMVVFQFEKEFGDLTESNKDGIRFKEGYLSMWIRNKQTTLIKVDKIKNPFSENFVNESFINLIKKDRYSFYKYINIDDSTNTGYSLITLIEKLLKDSKH